MSDRWFFEVYHRQAFPQWKVKWREHGYGGYRPKYRLFFTERGARNWVQKQERKQARLTWWKEAA